jgi:DNA/RNA endonuclease YhcR with UshA esterase domain
MICRMGHRICTALAIALAAIVAGGAPVAAHHSFQAEFDISKPMTVKGTVAKVEWVNPHVYVHVDVKDDKGAVTRWAFETLGPGRMRAEGMSKQTFGVGKVVTLKGYAARDGSKNLGFLRQVTFDDGHTVEVWLGDPDDLNP